MRYSAVIFDMDGLLLDSESLCKDAFFKACQQIGFQASESVYLSCIGCNEERTKALLIAGHSAAFPYDEIISLWQDLYRQRTHEVPVPLMKGAETLLTQLSQQNKRLAVATSTAHQLAVKKLKNANIHHYFDFIVGGDQVKQSKPAAEIYLKAAKLLQTNTQQCIAFEDSENGVRAAIAAGIEVIQIPDLIAPSDELLSWGHIILPSLENFQI